MLVVVDAAAASVMIILMGSSLHFLSMDKPQFDSNLVSLDPTSPSVRRQQPNSSDSCSKRFLQVIEQPLSTTQL